MKQQMIHRPMKLVQLRWT